ncbi:uncharacterized protein ATC70_013017 [Mucor velutinosus]|uniref:Uncharacterized protein n=1 Tax=Mucor velutinosus TaxID=708070 RepID=A0AAN7DAE2_9FUNG|nr:hypothetical protein ATC70_013017 [Mucor velutinosus]
MPQLDPFIIYTVKLAMNYQSVEEPVAPAAPQDEKAMLVQQDTNNPMFPETLARIMTIKTFPLKTNEKAPKLQRENILSLLYHADEQWLKSTLELKQSIKREEASHQYAVNHVHRQQRIFLDTCHILHKHLMDIPKKFNEPIWFAAQVLHRQCQIRHLEQFTSLLKPLASDVWIAMEQLRRMIHRLVQKQHQHAAATSGFLAKFFSSTAASTSFYSSPENHLLLQSLVPYLTAFEQRWSTFEKSLYECYVLTVFGKHDTELLQRNISHDIPLSPTLFSDALTQLLPLALDRAMDRQLLDVGAIQTLDPIAFVALPRLAILAGVTWLAHVTGWRTTTCTTSNLPVWIQMHKETLDRIAAAFTQLEVAFLQTPSKEKHQDFVQLYKTLERALVDGCDDDRIKPIYVDICIVADSVLSSHLAQSFTMVLCHLFKHVGLQYDIEFEEEEDAVPIEQTLLDLAI